MIEDSEGQFLVDDFAVEAGRLMMHNVLLGKLFIKAGGERRRQRLEARLGRLKQVVQDDLIGYFEARVGAEFFLASFGPILDQGKAVRAVVDIGRPSIEMAWMVFGKVVESPEGNVAIESGGFWGTSCW